MATDDIFQNEYIVPPSTGDRPVDRLQDPPAAETTAEEQLARDVKQYGSGKPIRSITRAKIIND